MSLNDKGAHIVIPSPSEFFDQWADRALCNEPSMAIKFAEDYCQFCTEFMQRVVVQERRKP